MAAGTKVVGIDDHLVRAFPTCLENYLSYLTSRLTMGDLLVTGHSPVCERHEASHQLGSSTWGGCAMGAVVPWAGFLK